MNDDTIDEVVFDAIRFLESLTRYYGAERGMEVWTKMGDVLGDEIKGKVFFSMLTGEISSNRVRMQAGPCTDAVQVIKAVRTATGFSLKEAKDLWDVSKTAEAKFETKTRDAKKSLVRELRNLGMIVY